MSKNNKNSGIKTFDVVSDGSPNSSYFKIRNEEREFIKRHKNAPVRFSETNHYISLLVSGSWINLNGWSKEEYYSLINEKPKVDEVDLEILKLKEMLEKANITYKYIKNSLKHQIKIFRDYRALCDAIYGEGTQGFKQNLIEIEGGLTKEEMEKSNSARLGYLTAEEVFKRFEYCYNNRTTIYKEIK